MSEIYTYEEALSCLKLAESLNRLNDIDKDGQDHDSLMRMVIKFCEDHLRC